MTTSHRAKALAEEAVASLAAASGDEFRLMYDSTVEINEGWLFFYNSKEFIETGNPISSLAGNGPIFVNRAGVVCNLSSAVHWDEQLGALDSGLEDKVRAITKPIACR